MLPLGETLARLIYKQPTAGAFIKPLAFAAFFTFFQITTGCILNGIGKQRLNAISVVICSLIHMGFTWFAAGDPRIGMSGYVVGDLISAAFGAVLNIGLIMKYTHLSLRAQNWFIKPLLAALAAGFAAKLYVQWMGGTAAARPVTAALALLLCCAVYLVALHFQGVKLSEYLSKLAEKKLTAGN